MGEEVGKLGEKAVGKLNPDKPAAGEEKDKPEEPRAVQERLAWQLARRDDAKVAQALYAGEEVEESHELSEAGLLDEFFVFRQEVGMMALVERMKVPGGKPSPGPHGAVGAAVSAQSALWGPIDE